VRERKLRAELVAAGARMARLGLVRGSEGNFSARLDGESFLVSPRGRPKGALQGWELLRAPLLGPLPPAASSEAAMHQAILARHVRLGAVLHAHPPAVLQLLQVGGKLDAGVLRETAGILVPQVLPDLTPGSAQLAAAAAEAAAEANALLLPRHGAVVVGAGVAEALALLEALELAASVCLVSR
jgi:ribulose-5-phosphate 4-epimerase/fuculose-1-phosphate aldolase